jgi:hypothetical protein
MPRLLDELKPFAWLALAAFLTGFLSYLFVGDGELAVAREAPAVQAAPLVSAPASDEWNLPKRI